MRPQLKTPSSPTFKKGDALCISKLSKDGLWGKVYKVGWINLYDTSLKPDKGV